MLVNETRVFQILIKPRRDFASTSVWRLKILSELRNQIKKTKAYRLLFAVFCYIYMPMSKYTIYFMLMFIELCVTNCKIESSVNDFILNSNKV